MSLYFFCGAMFTVWVLVRISGQSEEVSYLIGREFSEFISEREGSELHIWATVMVLVTLASVLLWPLFMVHMIYQHGDWS